MTPRIDTRMYTNLVLTAIALLMLGGVARDYGVGIVGSAQAQVARGVTDNIGATATGVVYDANIPQTQDVAVAAATSAVAASNLEIAAAIRELALAVREGASDVSKGMQRSSNSSAAPATAPSASSVPSERPTVEVTR